jgi:hypothetical protein
LPSKNAKAPDLALRDWDGGGNRPGYGLGTWLRDYKEQVFLPSRS